MSWGPDGETKREDRPLTIEELNKRLAKHDWPGLRRFVSMIEPGDVVTYHSESNRNRGRVWYSCTKRDLSISITLSVSFRMS